MSEPTDMGTGIPVPQPPTATEAPSAANAQQEFVEIQAVPLAPASVNIEIPEGQPEFQKRNENVVVRLLESKSLSSFFGALEGLDKGNIFENRLVALFSSAKESGNAEEITEEVVEKAITELAKYPPLVVDNVVNRGVLVHLTTILKERASLAISNPETVVLDTDVQPAPQGSVISEGLQKHVDEQLAAAPVLPTVDVSAVGVADSPDQPVTPTHVDIEVGQSPSIKALLEARTLRDFISTLAVMSGEGGGKAFFDEIDAFVAKKVSENGGEVTLDEMRGLVESGAHPSVAAIFAANITLLPKLTSLVELLRNEKLQTTAHEQSVAETEPAPLLDTTPMGLPEISDVTPAVPEVAASPHETTPSEAVVPKSSEEIIASIEAANANKESIRKRVARGLRNFGNRLIGTRVGQASTIVAREIKERVTPYGVEGKNPANWKLFDAPTEQQIEASKNLEKRDAMAALARVKEKTEIRKKYVEAKVGGTDMENLLSDLFHLGEEWRLLSFKKKMAFSVGLAGAGAFLVPGAGAATLAALWVAGAAPATLRSVDYYRKLKEEWPTRSMFSNLKERGKIDAKLIAETGAVGFAALLGFGIGKLLSIADDIVDGVQKGVSVQTPERPLIIEKTEPQVPELSEQEKRELEAQMKRESETVKALSAQEEVQALQQTVHEVQPGDKVWTILKDELQKRGAFEGLSNAEQNKLIIERIEILERNPKNFGLSTESVGLIHPGDKFEVGKLLHIAETGERTSSIALPDVAETMTAAIEPETAVVASMEAEAKVSGYLTNGSSYTQLFGMPDASGAMNTTEAFQFLRSHAGESVASLFAKKDSFDDAGKHVIDRLAGLSQAYFREDVTKVTLGSEEDKSVLQVIAAVDSRLPHSV